jgi:hypothetical protein
MNRGADGGVIEGWSFVFLKVFKAKQTMEANIVSLSLLFFDPPEL